MESLTRQLDEARQEHDFRRREAEETRQRNGTLARENGRLLTQVQDMGRQVTALTVEVEASRSGTPRMRRVSDASSSASALNQGLNSIHFRILTKMFTKILTKIVTKELSKSYTKKFMR